MSDSTAGRKRQAVDIDAFRVRVAADLKVPGLKEIAVAVLKPGPFAYKSAALMGFGSKASDLVTKRELRVQTYQVDRAEEGGLRQTERHWSCENEEVEKLIAFLLEQFPSAGKYTLVKGETDVTSILRAIQSGGVDSDVMTQLIDGLTAMPDAAPILAKMDGYEVLASIIRQHQQQMAVDKLQTVVEDPASKEPDIHRVLDKQWWIFGGRFISRASRRRITVLDELDIPLIRSDGALHVVELKQANIPELVVRHRNHAIVGEDVHKATAQAMNYLRELDEHRAQILVDIED